MAGVGPNQMLLAPAYHCRTMLDPATALGADIKLYPLLPDLAPDLGAIERLLARHRRDGPHALLATHYFGIPQDFTELAALCRTHRTTLIEDCSHAMVLDPALTGTADLAGRIGTYADLGISSPYKFLPSQDGGLLWCNAASQGPPPQLTPPPASLARRAAFALLRELVSRNPDVLTPIAPSSLPIETKAIERVEQACAPSADYHADEQNWTSLASTRWLMGHTRLDTLAAQRRLRYRQWAAAASGIDGCRPLRIGLADDVIPYMFPLLLDDKVTWPAFFRLKHAGLPIWRWDQMASSECAVSMGYRLRLLHLPCHQGLTDGQMAWMTATLAAVMASLPRTGSRTR